MLDYGDIGILSYFPLVSYYWRLGGLSLLILDGGDENSIDFLVIKFILLIEPIYAF